MKTKSKKANVKKVRIFDTLFRDGMQGAGMKISLESAVKLIVEMDRLGFDYAELGFAGANKFTSDLVAKVLSLQLDNLKPAVFARTRKPGEKIDENIDMLEILKLKVPVAVVVAKSRLFDVENSLRTSGEENLEMIVDTIEFLKNNGLEVIVDLEHAVDAWVGRTVFGRRGGEEEIQQGRQYFKQVIEVAIKSGVDCLVICDTNGGASPEEIKEMFSWLVENYPEQNFGIHCHNDNDLALANTRQAVLSGAKHVQGVSGGFGERCGNVDLLTVIARLTLKDGIEILNKESLRKLSKFYQSITEAFSLELSGRKPFFGRDAFGTYAGMHASSEVRSEGAYLQCNPLDVGNVKRIGVNFQSGRANVAFLANQMGFNLTATELADFTKRFSLEIEYGAFEVSEDSFWLACYLLKNKEDFFEVLSYQTGTAFEKGELFGQANLKLRLKGGKKEAASQGEGAFDALWRALFSLLKDEFPQVQKIELVNYDLHALEVESKHSGAPVRVLTRFKNNGTTWTSVGVSKSSVEAGLRAMVDGVRFYLARIDQG